LVGTAAGFSRFALADTAALRAFSASRGSKISEIGVELRKSG
jgi:hypothetical protein